jgi:predicted transcriptional regulator
MRHGIRFSDHSIDYSIILWIIGILVVILLISLIIFLFKRIWKKSGQDKNITGELNDEEIKAQINSMLYQHGNDMDQTETGRNMNLPLDRVSKILNEMDKNNEIIREWNNERYTYLVTLNM